MATPWKNRYAQRTQRMGRSVIRELLKLTQQPDIISFAGGLPAPETFPIEEIREAACKVLEEHGTRALQYGQTEGYLPLRQFICERMNRYGIKAEPGNVFITTGSQQALDLIGKLLINPGDRVLVEEPTYLGALQAWNAYQAEYVSVPSDDHGLCTHMLEDALRVGPKFMYILPNFQNPGGTTLPLERRLDLVRLSNKYGIPLVEDDPYGALRYEGEHLPPLVALDADYQSGAGLNGHGFMEGNVIYLGTFSKTLAPGLRLGWVVAPVEVIDQLVMAKQGTDLHSSTFDQMLAYEALKTGFLDEHIRKIRQIYKERRDVMLSALERYFPAGCSWTHPEGGLFLWARVPEWIDTAELLQEAIAKKVAYVPGFAFYPDARHGRNTMRLNFSNAQPAQIEEGIRRLGNLLKEKIARHQKLKSVVSLSKE
ncbi:MAG: PLP-dependent aminotransferase family protein [Anaerolineae bacterium]|nr:PLP-dependent aminotransferase family protein [Anaerolineae bacterium]